ncbi:hypothetical protein H6P81_003761 [Aristolochia fimbriata]|uniref:AAA+ ATPase domain-containing protein n=1 Tax=Aristolochia fimbriata TaxID=158543 RepID=A0AAV7FEC2_ARIFI|nr:hypothetical protein H6P81_003761 [Aristolochia fimbriata]
MGTATSLVSTAVSLAGSAMLFRSVVDGIVPREVQDYIADAILTLFRASSPKITTIYVEILDGGCINKIYMAVDVYLGARVRPPSTKNIRVTKEEKNQKLRVSIERGEMILDRFEGMELQWSRTFKQNSQEKNKKEMPELPRFALTFDRRYKDRVLKSYLPHVLREAKALKRKNKGLKLLSVKTCYRYCVNFEHPATFDSIAMEPDLKRALIADLDRFVRRKDFYRRVGKAWKRGYLLYGPPGTGKSSLIAAIANYLNFNVYDLELAEIHSNSELRKVLLSTSNRSILVIEDIDCTDGVVNRNQVNRAESNITLSGLLNFIDGLWSSCGNERIIIFTTNHKEKLDPALLRPGRMDMHIHMSYCTPAGFKILANNYLGIQDHRLFGDIEALILDQVKVTPAQVAEELMKHADKPDVCLNRLLQFLCGKKTEETRQSMTDQINGLGVYLN